MSLQSYSVYPNPFMTVTSDGKYTKHYYAGTQRIASYLSTNSGNLSRSQDSTLVAGSNTAPDPDPEADFSHYAEKAGLDVQSITTELKSGSAQNGIYYIHGDYLGTGTFVTDGDGIATQFFLNLPFGETFVEQQVTGKYPNPYKFNAKELDSETGLYYYGARYYNPRLSIWYGVDPLAEEFPSWSPYAYAFDNPVRFIDPDGMAPQDQSEMDCCSILLQGAGRGITILGTGGSAGGAFTAGLATLPFVIAGIAYASNVKQKEFLTQRSNEFSALSHKEEKGRLLKESFPVAEKDNLIIRDFPSATKQKITILSADYSKNDKKKVNSANVGDIVQTPDSNPENFNKKGTNYTNSKTKEIWQKSTTEHSGEKEWKVGIGKNEPTKSKKITVTASDRKILKINL